MIRLVKSNVKLIIKVTGKNLSHEELKNLLIQRIGEFEFVFVSPNDKSYKIDEIRSFINQLNKKQNNLTKNIFYILTNGDDLSVICQNALLKTLEESKYPIGIIVTNPFNLLPTVLSRCQIVFINFKKKTYETDIEITFDNISELTKLERKDLIALIEQKMFSCSEFLDILHYQDAINKLKANCKTESVLLDLYFKIKQSY